MSYHRMSGRILTAIQLLNIKYEYTEPYRKLTMTWSNIYCDVIVIIKYDFFIYSHTYTYNNIHIHTYIQIHIIHYFSISEDSD